MDGTRELLRRKCAVYNNWGIESIAMFRFIFTGICRFGWKVERVSVFCKNSLLGVIM